VRFDHLGVITSDPAAGRRLLGQSIGVAEWTDVLEDPLQDVFVQFGRCASGICYEVIAPGSAASPISRMLSAKVNTLNHVAYLVDDLAREADRLAQAGFIAIGEAKPGIAFDNHLIQFFISPARLMIELIEAPGHRHKVSRRAATVTETS